jgi:hypothetical protein
MAVLSLHPLHGVSPGAAAMATMLSLGGLAFAALEGWPVWARGLAAVLPWLPIFVHRLAAIYRDYHWLALFYGLVVTQTAHLLEHVAQMTQIHLMGLTGPDARGIFGALDIEWVHFIWNTWVLLAVLVLLRRFGSDPWLRLTALLSGWHELEHVYIFSVYLATGVSGTPGLLSHGGVLGGGLPISRPDLHCVYNLVETTPLVAAFLSEVRRTSGPERPAFGVAASGSCAAAATSSRSCANSSRKL